MSRRDIIISTQQDLFTVPKKKELNFSLKITVNILKEGTKAIRKFK